MPPEPDAPSTAPQPDLLREAIPVPPTSEQAPPKTVVGILRRLGPGLIIAGSIVGSGELIATTTTGAHAGFWLLWLIIIGCMIKVFAQIEFGRYTITTGNTSMAGMNEVPGPRLVVNWLLWYWFATFIICLGQLGGIVGGVGQALAISAPLTAEGRELNELRDAGVQLKLKRLELSRLQPAAGALAAAAADASPADANPRAAELQSSIAALEARVAELEAARARRGLTASSQSFRWSDDAIWSGILAVATSLLLVVGRYGFIQTFSMVLVASFTVVTVANVIALQMHEQWAVTWTDLVNGLSFQLPQTDPSNPDGWKLGLFTALATFGIIGVGANELIAYPYWCLEKGYARFTGRRNDSPEWAERARGWMRVMRWDAWCSMIVYTFATIAFYLLGAAILGRSGLVLEGSEMIRTLGAMYEPVFGHGAQVLFLFGAFAVLYSTYFVASASQARVASDAFRVARLGIHSEAQWRVAVRVLSALIPLVCFAVYFSYRQPVKLVLAGGMMQAMMLPMLAVATLFFRYRRCDARLAPGKLWDVMLWLSSTGLIIAGGWLAWSELSKLLPEELF